MFDLFSVREADGVNFCLSFLQRNIDYLGLLFFNDILKYFQQDNRNVQLQSQTQDRLGIKFATKL